LLERIKTLYNDVPGLTPDKIAPTVGQNSECGPKTRCRFNTPSVGKITLPSTILKFWDLGGQKGIRSIWPRYYDDCHAVVYVIDAEDRERLGEGWEVFGTTTLPHPALLRLTDRKGHKDSVLSNPQILNAPLLLLANKQDSPQSLSVEEIRRDYEEWFQNKIENSRRTYEYDSPSDMHHRRERIASLDVMGVSALEGYVLMEVPVPSPS